MLKDIIEVKPQENYLIGQNSDKNLANVVVGIRLQIN